MGENAENTSKATLVVTAVPNPAEMPSVQEYLKGVMPLLQGAGGELVKRLKVGAVVTVEPGVYLQEERLGIRLEDDVLVTEGEPRVLSAAIPIDPDELERSGA